MVISKICKRSIEFEAELNEMKMNLEHLLKTWVNSDLVKEIKKQFKTIKKEGPGCRLKLALLG